jgi:hypothetical protein
VTGARALRAGPGAVRALRAGGTGRVELVLGSGGYVALGTRGWLLLGPPRVQHGPLSVHVAGLRPLVDGAPARVANGWLEVGEQRIALAGMRLTRRRPLAGDGDPRAVPGVPAGGTPPALAPGVAALARADLESAVDLLAGRGEGLTPAGDDVLAGWAGWKAAAGAPVAVADAAAGRTTALSVAYLRCAERGELPEPAEALIGALWAGDAAAARRSARRLAGWGATSGRAIMLGMAVAGGAARTGRARPAPAPRCPPAAPSPRR